MAGKYAAGTVSCSPSRCSNTERPEPSGCAPWGYHPQRKEWWVIELKHGRPADDVVGQVSPYLGWVSAECARRGEMATGAIVARDANDKLRYAVRANPRLTLWTWDEELQVTRI
jgi:hypothetical protein